jgi:hypothetical protein
MHSGLFPHCRDRQWVVALAFLGFGVDPEDRYWRSLWCLPAPGGHTTQAGLETLGPIYREVDQLLPHLGDRKIEPNQFRP